MKRTILLSIAIFLSLSSGSVWVLDYESSDPPPYTEREIKAIKAHYGLTKHQPMFTEQQMQALSDRKLNALVRVLIAHRTIKFEEIVDVIDFSREIIESGLNFKDIEPRIVRSIDKGEVVFMALEKAITREKFHQWHAGVVKRISEKNGAFVSKVQQLDLPNSDKRRVINVYATCIASFQDDNDRLVMSTSIGEPLDEYNAPRYRRYPVVVREDHDWEQSVHNVAYQALMHEAKEVAENYNLSTFEKVVMAKCIAEQSLRFFLPSHHPFKAWHKHRMLRSKAPEDAFFMHTGVCSNFSGIAYNAALELGLRGKIHLAKNGVHVYLEFEELGQWYHAHPFNSKSGAVITRFMSNPPKEPR